MSSIRVFFIVPVAFVQNTFAYFTGHKREHWQQDDNKIKVTTAVRRALNRKATTRLSFAPVRCALGRRIERRAEVVVVVVVVEKRNKESTVWVF